METSFEPRLAEGYKSKSQIARVLTESWTKAHMYCPICGHPGISKFPNNKAAADFFARAARVSLSKKVKTDHLGIKLQMAHTALLFKEYAATTTRISF